MFTTSCRSRSRSSPKPSARMTQLPPAMRTFVTAGERGAIFPYPRRHPHPSAYRPTKRFTVLTSGMICTVPPWSVRMPYPGYAMVPSCTPSTYRGIGYPPMDKDPEVDVPTLFVAPARIVSSLTLFVFAPIFRYVCCMKDRCVAVPCPKYPQRNELCTVKPSSASTYSSPQPPFAEPKVKSFAETTPPRKRNSPNPPLPISGELRCNVPPLISTTP